MVRLKKLALAASVGGLLFVSSCLGSVPWRIVSSDAAMSAHSTYSAGGSAAQAGFDLLTTGNAGAPAG